MFDKSKIEELNKIATAMVAPGKGILAADESLGTIEKRFSKINLPNTEENRQAYREMLFTTKGIGDYISGVIMFDETIRQKTRSGVPFVEVLTNAGPIPGIKVDQGTEETLGSPNEKITKGLDGLPERLKGYVRFGARFAKWRAVITIGDGIPTDENISENNRRLAKYAKMCQEAGLMPMVEPEVLMDGSHSMERCEEVSLKTLESLFVELAKEGVALEGMILKTNMVLPAKDSGQKATPEQIAEMTLRLFKKVLPNELPGEAFLSGGQSETGATENLNAINQTGPFPWKLTFSYGRALQDSALK
ncbi:MAG: fructose-bisphosphate aldolase class I, partial [Candidatus Doudnabacteria bacterium]|nr:fructose-bisphosphate aldolase class I [Candidatus Doudnabacteria bacterium]